MKIVLASKNPIKVQALRDALKRAGEAAATFISVAVPSGVNEQPVEGEETAKGAKNRLQGAREKVPDADLYVAIENGIFRENDEWVDKAFILFKTIDGTIYQCYTPPIELPTDMVREAQERGFAQVTVGAVMKENGLIEDAANPHHAVRGVSRKELLQEAMVTLLRDVMPERRFGTRYYRSKECQPA